MSASRYHPNAALNDASALCKVTDPDSELLTCMAKLVKTYNPYALPDPRSRGLFAGPISCGYLFYRVSQYYPDLKIPTSEGSKSPLDLARAYLAADTEPSLPLAGGVRDDTTAGLFLRALIDKDDEVAKELTRTVEDAHATVDKGFNEWVIGRPGHLALLRIVRKVVTDANVRKAIDRVCKLLTDHVLASRPWQLRGGDYIGAAHGDIGNITQVVLTDPTKAADVMSDLETVLDLQEENGHWPLTRSKEHETGELVHWCHGSPGFVSSLVVIREFFPQLRDKIDAAIENGRKEIWEKGFLKKHPGLCHGVTGNALCLEGEQREHFMALSTESKVEEGVKSGLFEPGDDPYTLWWGLAGRAWGWLAMSLGKDIGFPAYSDDWAVW